MFSRLLSSCGQAARFVEVVCGAVYLECVLPHIADDVEKEQQAQSGNNQVGEHRRCPLFLSCAHRRDVWVGLGRSSGENVIC